MSRTATEATDAGDRVEEEKKLVEVFESFHAKIRVVREHHNMTIPEAIQKFCFPAVEKAYRKIVRDMNAEVGGEG